MLQIYRRHNPAKCHSADTARCDDKRRGCPIWARGSLENGRYIRQPLKTRDWTRATDLCRELEATGKLPVKVAAGETRTTIEAWRDQFINNAKAENLSHETIRKYQVLFGQLLVFTKDRGIRFVNELDLPALQDFRNSWKDKPLSKSKKQERLRTIFKFAVAHKWIGENPALLLGRIRVEPTQQLPFTDEEMTAIFNAAKGAGPRIYTFILLMRFAGLRISDCCMLRVDSLQGNHLVLRTEKTSVPVKVLLPEIVAESLRTIQKETPKYFFWNGRTGLKSTTNLWRDYKVKPVFEKAKIENAHPHRFRHTFAVNLLRQGISTATVASLLGNSEAIVTKHYSAWVAARQQGLDEAVIKANGFHDLTPIGAS